MNKNKTIIVILILIIIALVIALICIANNNINLKKEAISSSNLLANREDGKLNETTNSNIETKNDDDTNDNLDYINTKTAKVLLNRQPYYAELSINNGNLYVKENGRETVQNQTFSINGEKIKYLHYDYYQSADTNVIFYLTESGNLYVNEFICDEGLTIDIINNFKKLDYNNVKELVKQKNENYLMENEVGIIDYKEFYIYALTDNELVKISNQYGM